MAAGTAGTVSAPFALHDVKGDLIAVTKGCEVLVAEHNGARSFTGTVVDIRVRPETPGAWQSHHPAWAGHWKDNHERPVMYFVIRAFGSEKVVMGERVSVPPQPEPEITWEEQEGEIQFCSAPPKIHKNQQFA